MRPDLEVLHVDVPLEPRPADGPVRALLAREGLQVEVLGPGVRRDLAFLRRSVVAVVALVQALPLVDGGDVGLQRRARVAAEKSGDASN